MDYSVVSKLRAFGYDTEKLSDSIYSYKDKECAGIIDIENNYISGCIYEIQSVDGEIALLVDTRLDRYEEFIYRKRKIYKTIYLANKINENCKNIFGLREKDKLYTLMTSESGVIYDGISNKAMVIESEHIDILLFLFREPILHEQSDGVSNCWIDNLEHYRYSIYTEFILVLETTRKHLNTRIGYINKDFRFVQDIDFEVFREQDVPEVFIDKVRNTGFKVKYIDNFFD